MTAAVDALAAEKRAREQLGRELAYLIGRYSRDGVVPVDELRELLDRDLDR